MPDSLLRELAELGMRVEEHFGGVPQDVEWAIADGRISLLQARPITSLPPAPLSDVRWESPLPGATWVRRQVVEHMPEPLSPLFEDLYLNQGLERSIRAIANAMGINGLFERLFEGPFFTTVNGYGYSRGNFNITRQTALPLIRSFISGPPWLFRHGVEYWREEGVPPYLETLARWQDVSVTESLSRFEDLAAALGADLEAPALVAARERFARASEAVRQAAAVNPDLTVLVMSAWPEAIYVANPPAASDLTYFQELGVNLVVPDAPDAYWEELSWEQALKYPADVILLDERDGGYTVENVDEAPSTLAAHPAVKAGQLGNWYTEFVLSYDAFAAVLEELATTIGEARGLGDG